MDTLALKRELTEKINKIENTELLSNLNNIVNDLMDFQKDYVLWEELPDDVKKRIELAESQIELGKGIPHEEVVKDINKRLDSLK